MACVPQLKLRAGTEQMLKALDGSDNAVHQRHARNSLTDANRKIGAIRSELRTLLQDLSELTIPELETKLRTEQEMHKAALKMVELLGNSKTPSAKKQMKEASKNVRESQKLVQHALLQLREATLSEDVEIASATGTSCFYCEDVAQVPCITLFADTTHTSFSNDKIYVSNEVSTFKYGVGFRPALPPPRIGAHDHDTLCCIDLSAIASKPKSRTSDLSKYHDARARAEPPKISRDEFPSPSISISCDTDDADIYYVAYVEDANAKWHRLARVGKVSEGNSTMNDGMVSFGSKKNDDGASLQGFDDTEARVYEAEVFTANNASVDTVAVGSRVSVAGYECGGTVRFVGPHHAGKGPRVLVELDLPDGKNNGTIDGHVYAQVPEGYGVLVKPEKVAELPATNYGMTGLGFAVNEDSVYSNNLIVGSQKLALFRVLNKQGDDNILTQSELEDALGNQEFLDFVAEQHIDLKQTKDTADSARRMFKCLDKNDSGDVTMDEFLQGLEKLGRGVISVQVSQGALAASAAKLPASSTQSVSYDDFASESLKTGSKSIEPEQHASSDSEDDGDFALSAQGKYTFSAPTNILRGRTPSLRKSRVHQWPLRLPDCLCVLVFRLLRNLSQI